MKAATITNYRGVFRFLLALIVAEQILLGVWALLGPHSFWSTFPGAGHHWVSAFGPYSAHLVTDFGSLNLAIGVVALFALISLQRLLVQAFAVAFLVWELPHFLFHAFHTTHQSTFDFAGGLIGIALNIVVGAVLLALTFVRPERGPEEGGHFQLDAEPRDL